MKCLSTVTIIIMLSFLGSQWAVREKPTESQQDGTLGNAHDICSSVLIWTIARKKVLPAANQEKYMEFRE